ncbi:pyocin knob domain-containing protein [Dysosmobacter welbionis]|jgi:hypothetical protein|uniref:pyocin knob domain-containing protein n=2 Tax=Eubacteriales TaxID=186802 RepID=UPI0003AE3BFB|nr:pyocin knob domain-containing protein [Oscillibacter sp. KLE 1728]ERK65155.1 hypothetical protein HMPREF1545_00127 [Oscillibacter sp. KLE 1728]
MAITIEELAAKVAELEQQMATIPPPPTEYYTSAYSGEEIDAAIKKVNDGIVGGVSSFNGRTGAVLPQAGDYNATQIPVSGDPEAENVAAALANKAPGGFGLGEQSKELTSDDDLNAIQANGWYRWGSSAPQNAPNMSPGNGDSGYIFARVANYDSQNVLQEYWSLNQGAQNKAHRICRNGVWGPLEWINPPMQLGVEYRTIERYQQVPIYTKAVNFGTAPNATSKTVEHGITGFNQCVDVSGILGGANLIGHKNIVGILVNASQITIEADADLSRSNVYVILKYTKTTS